MPGTGTNHGSLCHPGSHRVAVGVFSFNPRRRSYAVDADPVTVAYAVPAAAITHTAAPDIDIADFDQAGLRPPIVLAVFLADISGNFLTGSSNNVDPIPRERSTYRQR